MLRLHSFKSLSLSLFVRFALLLALTFAALSAHAQQYLSVTDLGTLGGNYSVATGVNNFGQVIGSSLTSLGASESFLYSHGVMQDIGAFTTVGINNNGQICVNYAGSACLWQNGTLTVLGPLGVVNEVHGINDSGQIVGAYQTANLPDGTGRAFIWQNGSYTDLDPTRQFPESSSANAVNANGLIAGQAQISNGGPLGIATFSNNQVQYLGAPNGRSAYAKSVNSIGQMICVGIGADGNYHAFLYQAGQTTDIGSLGGASSRGLAINGNGQVVGWSTIAGQTTHHAFVWQNGTMTDLNSLINPALGWVLLEADGISDTGYIAGVGTHNGQTRAFLMQIQVPAGVVPVSLVFSPNPVQVGQATFGAVTLSGPAPAGGTAVSFMIGGNASGALIIPAGQRTGQFRNVFYNVYGGQTIPATASANGGSASDSVQVIGLPYSLTSISPSSVTLGGPDFTLTLKGAGFTPSSVACCNGAVLPTTFVSATQLTATISAGLIARPNLLAVNVMDTAQGGGGTDALALNVVNPLPVIGSLNPATVKMGSATFTLTVNGTGFTLVDNNNGYQSGSVVRWSGTALPTTYVSPTQLTASVPASNVTSAASIPITVFNPAPGGGTSTAQTFTVETTAPTPTSLNPVFVVAGGPDFTLTVTGINFTPTCVAQWSRTNLTTTYVSPTQLTAVVPAALTVNPALYSIYVTDTSSNTIGSSAIFTVANPVPTLSAISPATAPAGSPDITLTVTGTGFTQTASNGGGYPFSGSNVSWNSQSQRTTYVSPTQLTVTIPASLLVTAGTAQVKVVNSSGGLSNYGGGGTSSALPFTITAPPDTTAPTTTASLSGRIGSNGWYKSTVQITLSATDNANGSGVANTFYALDGGTQTLYSAPFVATGDGTHAVTFWSVDNAGNTEAVKTQTVKIDAAAPTLTFGAPTPAPNAAGWNNSTVSIPYTASDATSGVGYASPGSPVSFTAEGANQKQTVTVTDSAGNSAAFPTPAVSIDTTAPVTTASVSGTTVTLSASDALSGVASTFYTLDGGAQRTYSAPFVVSGDGTHTVSSWSVDNAGNTETVKTQSVTVDATAPVTTASLSGTAGANGWYLSAVQVTLSATDALSGVAATYYTLDGGSQQTYSAPFIVSGDGTHAVTFWSTDTAGNTEATKTQTVKIDAAAPTLTFGTPTPAPNAAGWNNSTVSIPYTASDATSGVASAMPGSPVSFTAEGANQKQTVTITDSAGNSAAFPTPAVSIDTTAPVTTDSVSGTAGTSGGYVSPVTVTLSATDNASGTASTFYTVDGGSQQTYAAPFAIGTGGTHTVAFWSVDNAGNTEATKTQTIQIDLSHFVGPVSLVFTPNPVQVGQATRGIVTLSNPAPVGGIVLSFARDGRAEGSIVVPAGASIVQDYEGFTSSYEGKTSTITATANGVTVSAAVQVTALPYTLLSISPSSVTVGGPDFTLTLTGTGFTPSSIALWNGIVLPTTYVSDTQISAQIPAAYIALSTIVAIYVSDATQGGGHTDYLFLTIGNPVPTLTGLNPAIASAGSPAVTFTVTGTGFAPYQVNNGGFLSGSTVLWNGQTLTTVYVSPTQVRATVPASLLASPGTAQVTVSNPEPGGGVSNALPFAVVSDTIAPTTTASVSGATVTLSATDNTNGSGVAGTFYTIDGGAQIAYSAPFTVAGEGTHSVSYWSVDNAGNSETARSVTVTVAPAKPTLSSLSPANAAAGGPSFTLTVNGTNFAATSLVKWNGTNRTTHFVSATQLTASISASDIAAVGTAQVTVTTPKVATTAALPFTMITRDTTAPTTTASPSGTAGTNGWYRSAVQVTLSAADNAGGSGVANTFYTLDGGMRTLYSAPFVATGDGAHAVTFWSVDNAGNTEAVKTQTVKIDATLPTLTFGTPTPAPNAAGWNNSTVSIPYTASDATSGVASAMPGSPVSFTAEGANQKQTVTVTDSAGNSAAFPTPAVSLDLTAPATTATLNGVFLKLTAADALSGVATTYYKINSNPVQIYTDLILPYSFSGQTDTILYWSVDKVGNTESVHTLSLKAGKPTLAGLSPASAAAGGAAFTLTVTGSNFFQGCIVKWNGIGKTTTFVSGSTLTAAIPASDIATAGTVQVTVTMPGWATTAPLPFTVTAGVVKPVIASLSPATKKAGSATFTLTVTGTGFASSSVVKWNTTSLKTTFVSATTLTASVSASLLTTAGTAQVTVTTPSVGTSPVKPFTITP